MTVWHEPFAAWSLLLQNVGVSIGFCLNSLGNSIEALGVRPLAGVAILRKVAKLAPHFKMHYYKGIKRPISRVLFPNAKKHCFSCNDMDSAGHIQQSWRVTTPICWRNNGTSPNQGSAQNH